MIKSIFVNRHEASVLAHVSRHSFPGITLPPGEATLLLFSLGSCLEHDVEEDSSFALIVCGCTFVMVRLVVAPPSAWCSGSRFSGRCPGRQTSALRQQRRCQRTRAHYSSRGRGTQVRCASGFTADLITPYYSAESVLQGRTPRRKSIP